MAKLHSATQCTEPSCPKHKPVEVECPTKGCKGHYYRTRLQVGKKETCGVCVQEVVLVPVK